MNHADIAALVGGLAPGIRDYFQDSVTPIVQRLKAIEERLATIETRPSVRYAGVWSDGRSYTEGNIVTYAGGLWFCQGKTTTKPNSGGPWQLIVKGGQQR